ncbi:unnamed protein product [Chilo suppressalis]|uniref:C2H2-type domain-containing protein n=1 Tax=Chilo suppressalis TaxID=168631 RepID=A0ABN8ARX3_CHISP|nr:unnamed protein product [Chilo suppressalis]
MDENDMIVVVIGDSDTEASGDLPPTQISLKTEPVDETDVMQMITAVQKHGKPIKLEFNDNDMVYVKEEFLEEEYNNFSEEETILGVCNNYIDEIADTKIGTKGFESDEDYVPEETSDDDDDNEYSLVTKAYEIIKGSNDLANNSESESELKMPKRRKQGSWAHQKSFVQNLKQEYPEMESDQKGIHHESVSDDLANDSESKSKLKTPRRRKPVSRSRQSIHNKSLYTDSQSESESEMPRRKHVSPSRRKSFVEELKQEYPELHNDEKALVSVLAEIMRNVEKPPLPKIYYTMVHDKFQCTICQALTDTEPAAGRHYREYHGPRYLVCYACGVDFRSNTNLLKHEKRCVAPDATTVLKARALSLGRKGRSRPFMPKPQEIVLRPPIRRKTTVTHKFKCNECPAAFSNGVSLEAHLNLHKGLRPYRCEVCNNAYTSVHRLKRHQKIHSEESYVCDHCGRIFKVKAALRVHLDTHLPVPKFGCEECPRRYATKAALKHHVRRVHLQLPPPCACPICPKSYPRMSLVKDHMKQAHGMSLMTRRMFLKALPKMTDEQLQQAKEILKSNVFFLNEGADNTNQNEAAENTNQNEAAENTNQYE